VRRVLCLGQPTTKWLTGGTHDTVRRFVLFVPQPDRYEAIIAGNEKDHAASGHWGVPTFVFENEPFFGQDRIDLLIWRMQSKGLTRRAA
jgi:hypothetical protein